METHTTDYVRFMEWLQNNHPDLYICCWQNIKASTQGGIGIVRESISDEHYKALTDAIRQFSEA
jgi:hypothetical protein